MTANNLIKAIQKRGGTAKLNAEHWTSPATERPIHRHSVVGELNGYDIEMFNHDSADSDFYTVRKISKRGHFDAGSDYNSGGYTFCNRIKELDCATSY